MHRAEVDGEQVLRGRQLVMESACGGCHGGADPSAEGWLAGYTGALPPEIQDYQVGPFHTYARNLTPDNTTGLGRFSERQIFNALRYGLRPGETPDVEITSSTPGEGNFPVNPKYLAPPMPWPAWRHMSDDDLWAIAAYLKRGVKPVRNRVEDSEGPGSSRFGIESRTAKGRPISGRRSIRVKCTAHIRQRSSRPRTRRCPRMERPISSRCYAAARP
jgi:mono/diheme cytochrome c family protein